MFMSRRFLSSAVNRYLACKSLSAIGVAIVTVAAPVYAADPLPRLGRPLVTGNKPAQPSMIHPDGRGLPAGSGTAAQGVAIYQERCMQCHGINGIGASAPELVGGKTPFIDGEANKTAGAFWPYATTLFDFISRAMPMNAPGALDADEVYALTAYLLHLNGVIDADLVMNRESLPRVRMPNRDGFVGIDASNAP